MEQMGQNQRRRRMFCPVRQIAAPGTKPALSDRILMSMQFSNTILRIYYLVHLIFVVTFLCLINLSYWF